MDRGNDSKDILIDLTDDSDSSDYEMAHDGIPVNIKREVKAEVEAEVTQVIEPDDEAGVSGEGKAEVPADVKAEIKAEVKEEDSEVCTICLEKFYWKCKLDCNHAFCLLCIKGTLATHHFCPLCRCPVPQDYALQYVGPACSRELNEHIRQFENTFLWYYQAQGNNWWMYERRHSIEIEKRFQEDPDQVIELIISGRIYVIDFTANVQYPKDFPQRRRQIKRDIFDPDCRGIAGFHLNLRLMERFANDQN